MTLVLLAGKRVGIHYDRLGVKGKGGGGLNPTPFSQKRALSKDVEKVRYHQKPSGFFFYLTFSTDLGFVPITRKSEAKQRTGRFFFCPQFRA